MTPRVAAIGFAIACVVALGLLLHWETHPPKHTPPPATETTIIHRAAGGTPQGPCWTCE